MMLEFQSGKMFVKLFVLVSIWAFVYTSEPECSSFHFLEKTLEKMIKTEHYVNQMKTEMETSQRNMSETLNAIKTDLEETKIALKVTKEDTNQFSDNMKAKSTGLTQASGVAFLARDLDGIYVGQGETLIFNTTVFDRGSGYDNNTGIYVTPVAGIYMFNLQLCLLRRSFGCFEIVSGTAPILKSCFDNYRGSRTGCHTANTVVTLGADENVWVKAVTTFSRYSYHADSSGWNTFSGVLIAP